ncbi:MAG: hypothetical protein WCA56_22600 [Xanthobacteraceae bacterium]
MKTARPWVKLLGLAAVLLLIAVAIPPRMIWLARIMLIAGAIFALLAVNAYFELSVLSGEPKNKKR